MGNAKIQIKVGIVEFSGEGDEKWLNDQLEKILKEIPRLLEIELTENILSTPASPLHSADGVVKKLPTNLAIFLKEKNATVSQVDKFLATAAFLQLKGKARLTTADINKALKDANQTRLGNASDNLNANVTKGFCEKDGKDFFVTVHGLESLGL